MTISFTKIKLIFNTVRFLLVGQIFYYGYYFILKKIGAYDKLPLNNTPIRSIKIKLVPQIKVKLQIKDTQKNVVILNLHHNFNGNVDWNFSRHGKLWTYQLNYFDFLHQENISKEEGLSLILDFVYKQKAVKDGLEPYCISVRLIQWIKFLSNHNITNADIEDSLYRQVKLLEKRVEYHIMANHILENTFALMVASFFFHDNVLYVKSKKLLLQQLDEQILSDGAHFERSPMYQAIILNRLLDVLNCVLQNKNVFNDANLVNQLIIKVSHMLAWLNGMMVGNSFPAFQDSTNTTPFLFDDLKAYAYRLGIELHNTQNEFSVSGYRKLVNKDFTLFADVGNPTPSYQPGHAHAGALGVVLYYKQLPVLVDVGVSTYANSPRRQIEKSTVSHNTVVVNATNQSEIWSAFRMGRRAKVTILEDNPVRLAANHNGYAHFNVIHYREITKSANGFVIIDQLDATVAEKKGLLSLHFHPDRTFTIRGDYVLIDDLVKMKFENSVSISQEPYLFAVDFNDVKTAAKLLICFKGKCTVAIETRREK